MPSKPPKAKLYYSIREVAESLKLEPYVLRFWEKEFPTLAPKKSRGGLRLYRQELIYVVQGIFFLQSIHKL